jgi:hypothetical protein
MQELKWREEHLLVSKTPVFVFMLPSTVLHCLSQPVCLGVTLVFEDTMMKSG